MINLRMLTAAGILRAALAGAMMTSALATPALAALTSVQTSDAASLAERIVQAVVAAQADSANLSEDAQKLRIETAIQQLIRDSGLAPEVAQAAVDMAYKRLADQGVLICVAPRRDVEEKCNPPGLALAAISGILQDVVNTQTTTTTGTPGPIPIGDPATLGPNSGTSDYRGG